MNKVANRCALGSPSFTVIFSFFVLFSIWLVARFVAAYSLSRGEKGLPSWPITENCRGSVVLLGRGTGSIVQDRVVGLGGPGDILSRKIIQSVLPFYAPEVAYSIKPHGPIGLSRSKDGFVYEIYNPTYRAILFRLGILDSVVLPADRVYLEAAGNDYSKKVTLVSGSIAHGVVVMGGPNEKLIQVSGSYVADYLNSHASNDERLFCR